MTGPDHDKFAGYAGLYALGALDAHERAEFQEHLEVCRPCVEEVTSLLPVSRGLAHAVPLREPPPALRSRVIEQVTGSPPATGAVESQAQPSPAGRSRVRSILLGLAAAATIVAAAGVGWFTARLYNQNLALRQSLQNEELRAARAESSVAAARAAAETAEAQLAILAAPDVVLISLAGQPAAPQASGRAFWSPTQGLLFTASDLPALPPDRVYQLWFVAPPGPVSAGLLQPDADGRTLLRIDLPPDLTMPVALGVTIEPAGGLTAPTGEMYLMGQPAV
jgi:anti-sigma-K factor RskA